MPTSFDDQIRKLNAALTKLLTGPLLPITPMAYHHQALLERADQELQDLTEALQALHDSAQDDLDNVPNYSTPSDHQEQTP